MAKLVDRKRALACQYLALGVCLSAEGSWRAGLSWVGVQLCMCNRGASVICAGSQGYGGVAVQLCMCDSGASSLCLRTLHCALLKKFPDRTRKEQTKNLSKSTFNIMRL